MSKKHQISKAQANKKRMVQVTVTIVLIAFVAYYVLSNLMVHKVEVNQDLEKALNQRTVYNFTKQGELAFISAKGDTISKIDVEVADDPAKRTRGLMFRDKMAENQGMIFLFDKEEEQSFWMHNTILPLDIIYINSRMEIVSIIKNAEPFNDTALPSLKPAQYVVEVNAGYTNKYNIKKGDKIVWSRIK